MYLVVRILFCAVFVQAQRLKDRINLSHSILRFECGVEEDDVGHIFSKLEIVPQLPGGTNEWFRFANSNFDFAIVERKLCDTVVRYRDSIVVKFIVTSKGKICNVQYQTGDAILLEPIKKLLKFSPSWQPGTNGGRQLYLYRTLRLDVIVDTRQRVRLIERILDSYFRSNE